MQLFDTPRHEKSLDVIPVSVIDIEPQGVRGSQDHGKVSSRSGFSPFPREVADLCFQFFMRDRRHVFDPFAGWGERAFAAKKYSVNYTGFDTSPSAIDSAKERFGVENKLADSMHEEIPSFDGLVTCPPYWNLEKYEGEGIDKIGTWEEFIGLYARIMSRCWDAAEPGSLFCVMVGDWRSKGVYYDLDFRTSMIFRGLGAIPVDKIVVSRKKTSKIKIMLPQCKRLGYTVRVHENLSVFKKP